MTDKEKEEKAELEAKIDHLQVSNCVGSKLSPRQAELEEKIDLLEVTVDELRGALNHHRRLLRNLARAVRIVNEVYLYAGEVDKRETELDELIEKRQKFQTLNSEVSHD